MIHGSFPARQNAFGCLYQSFKTDLIKRLWLILIAFMLRAETLLINEIIIWSKSRWNASQSDVSLNAAAGERRMKEVLTAFVPNMTLHQMNSCQLPANRRLRQAKTFKYLPAESKSVSLSLCQSNEKKMLLELQTVNRRFPAMLRKGCWQTVSYPSRAKTPRRDLISKCSH